MDFGLQKLLENNGTVILGVAGNIIQNQKKGVMA